MGNPVSHSRSPALHNAALAAAGLDAVYVPLLVDELSPFLHAFPSFSGFSVTVPHKVLPLFFSPEPLLFVRLPSPNSLACCFGGRSKGRDHARAPVQQ